MSFVWYRWVVKDRFVGSLSAVTTDPARLWHAGRGGNLARRKTAVGCAAAL